MDYFDLDNSIIFFSSVPLIPHLTKLNMVSNCLSDSGSEFEFRVVLLVWLLTLATEPRLLNYLPLIGIFEFRIFPSARPVARQGYRIQSVMQNAL